MTSGLIAGWNKWLGRAEGAPPARRQVQGSASGIHQPWRKWCVGESSSRGAWAAEEGEGSGAKCSHAVHVSAARNPRVCVDLGGCWTMESGPLATNSLFLPGPRFPKPLRKMPLLPSHRSLGRRQGRLAGHSAWDAHSHQPQQTKYRFEAFPAQSAGEGEGREGSWDTGARHLLKDTEREKRAQGDHLLTRTAAREETRQAPRSYPPLGR